MFLSITRISKYFVFFFVLSKRFTTQGLGCITRAKHTVPDLAYDYGDLEPYISADILKVHHGKHHVAYVNNLNIAEEKFAEAQAKG